MTRINIFTYDTGQLGCADIWSTLDLEIFSHKMCDIHSISYYPGSTRAVSGLVAGLYGVPVPKQGEILSLIVEFDNGKVVEVRKLNIVPFKKNEQIQLIETKSSMFETFWIWLHEISKKIIAVPCINSLVRTQRTAPHGSAVIIDHRQFQHEEKKMTILEIGCCGAYCKTCPEFRNTKCQGCKIGYENGKRDIKKAKCKMKVCCIEKGLNTCADCDNFPTCSIIQGFYGKKNYKYKKYEEAALFIRDKGYSNFLELADGWKNQYGKIANVMRARTVRPPR